MEVKPKVQQVAKIKVVGIGGCGNHVIQRLIKTQVRGVELLAVNTDAQDLHNTDAPKKIHIGKSVTRGLGAGMNPELGRAAAEESQDEIKKALEGSDMVFITAGMGGGTGTGAAPIIAEIAKEIGALTIGIVTKPFTFEGAQRRQIAENGIEQIESKVDSLITIPNDRILQVVDKKTSLLDAFSVVDDVLRQGVKGISELITLPGIVNVDFADVKAIMENSGSALMGIGKAAGENRAAEAAKAAIDSPLLELSIDGAKGVLFNISGGQDLSMFEIDEAAKVITESVDPEAKVIFGAVLGDNTQGEVQVTVIATGFDHQKAKNKKIVRAESGRVSEVLPWAALNAQKEPEMPKKAEPKRPMSSVTAKKESPADVPPEDELDIPAFIRNKMKS